MKKNVLIITAHPSPKGFAHRIAEAYQNASIEAGNTVELIDLYKTDLKQEFLTFVDPHDMGNPNTVRDIMKKKITDANELIFVHPMWWMGPPAIMKNWLDNNLAGGFAFKYVNGRPVGLLKGRTARVFISCDGAMWLYWLIAKPFWTIWHFGVLGFCGLKVKSIRVLDKKFKRTDAEKEAFLEKARTMARS